MKLFVGLGNPGAKYAQNRHNIGFMAMDRIAGDHGASPWRGKFQGQVCEVVLGGAKTLLLKPDTFMNKSGQSVAAAVQFYKIDVADIVVFHDELDLAPGKLRVKTGGGLAGHNGLKSINAHLGPEFQRVRIGIGHPGRKEFMILPRLRRSGLRICCAGFLMVLRSWRVVMLRSFRTRWLCARLRRDLQRRLGCQSQSPSRSRSPRLTHAVLCRS